MENLDQLTTDKPRTNSVIVLQLPANSCVAMIAIWLNHIVWEAKGVIRGVSPPVIDLVQVLVVLLNDDVIVRKGIHIHWV